MQTSSKETVLYLKTLKKYIEMKKEVSGEIGVCKTFNFSIFQKLRLFVERSNNQESLKHGTLDEDSIVENIDGMKGFQEWRFLHHWKKSLKHI